MPDVGELIGAGLGVLRRLAARRRSRGSPERCFASAAGRGRRRAPGTRGAPALATPAADAARRAEVDPEPDRPFTAARRLRPGGRRGRRCRPPGGRSAATTPSQEAVGVRVLGRVVRPAPTAACPAGGDRGRPASSPRRRPCRRRGRSRRRGRRRRTAPRSTRVGSESSRSRRDRHVVRRAPPARAPRCARRTGAGRGSPRPTADDLLASDPRAGRRARPTWLTNAEATSAACVEQCGRCAGYDVRSGGGRFGGRGQAAQPVEVEPALGEQVAGDVRSVNTARPPSPSWRTSPAGRTSGHCRGAAPSCQCRRRHRRSTSTIEPGSAQVTHGHSRAPGPGRSPAAASSCSTTAPSRRRGSPSP